MNSGYMEFDYRGDPLADVVPMPGDNVTVGSTTETHFPGQRPARVTAVEVIIDSETHRRYRIHYELTESAP